MTRDPEDARTNTGPDNGATNMPAKKPTQNPMTSIEGVVMLAMERMDMLLARIEDADSVEQAERRLQRLDHAGWDYVSAMVIDSAVAQWYDDQAAEIMKRWRFEDDVRAAECPLGLDLGPRII